MRTIRDRTSSIRFGRIPSHFLRLKRKRCGADASVPGDETDEDDIDELLYG